MRAAALAAALLLGACAHQEAELASCPKRDFEGAPTEEIQAKLDAAIKRGRDKMYEHKRLDPEFPTRVETMRVRPHYVQAQACSQYGYYDEAAAELEKAYEAMPDDRKMPITMGN